MSKIDDIVRQLCELKVAKLAQLLCCWKLSGELGSVMVSAPTAAASTVAKVVCDVVLIKPGRNKIAIIKEVRSLLSLGLKEAKEFVDGAPKLIKCALKAKFEALGAEIELN